MKFVAFGESFFWQLGNEPSNVTLPSTTAFAQASFEDGESKDLSDVRDIQLGSKFSAVVTVDSGKVYVCGCLAGVVYTKLTRIEVRYPLKCLTIAAGRKHMLMLMEGSHVLSMGIGYFGQLGHGNDESFDAPELVKQLEPTALGSRVTKIACGGSHSGVVTEDGRVFMFGLNKQGQCGVGKNISSSSDNKDSIMEPRPVDFSGILPIDGAALRKGSGRYDVKVSVLVCGRNHSAILSADGRVFAYGAASYGRLGLGTVRGDAGGSGSSSSAAAAMNVKKTVNAPSEIPFFRNNSIPVHSIASGDMHMLALTHDCAVYSWGLNSDGQCATGDLDSLLSPRKIGFFDASMQVVQVAAGSAWSMVVTANGALYGWGCNDSNCLNIARPAYPDPLPVLEPPEIGPPEPGSVRPPQQSSGSYKHIRCFDSQHNVLLPVRVRALAAFHVDSVRCGGNHNVVFVRARSIDAETKDCNSTAQDKAVVAAESLLVSPAKKAEKEQDKGKGRDFAVDKAVATGGFGLQPNSSSRGKEVNSKEDAKVYWQADGKAAADQSTTTTPISSSHAGSSSSSVAEALSTCETDELSAQCISWSRHRRVEEIEYALTRGVDIDVRDAAGNTMLIVAAQNRSTTVISALVNKGADLNIANAKGNTALHYLFAYGFEAEAEWLIAQGADDYAQNLEGYTCYEMGLADS